MFGADSGEAAPDFEAARDAVEGYFGELVAEVALEAPLSRTRLLAALARVQRAAVSGGPRATAPPVLHAGPAERVVHLPEVDWEALVRSGGLTQTEAAAAREVHRRLAETVTADSPPGGDPLVVVGRPGPPEPD